MSRAKVSAVLFAMATGLTLANGAHAAQSECQLSVESGGDNWVMPYDPFSQSDTMRQFDVAVVNRGETGCAGLIRVDLQGEPFGLTQPGSAQRLSYVLIDERGGTDLTPRAGISNRRVEARPIQLAAGERGLLRFTFAVAPSEMLTAGIYSQSASILLESAAGEPLLERRVTLGIDVLSAAVMGLKGRFRRTDGMATIDLGELTEGVRDLSSSLYVLSTGSYAISVSSENEGRLQQTGTEWSVPYDLSLGSRELDLKRGDRLEVISRRPRADDYPLRLRIGDVEGRRAGRYGDVVTFTIAAF